MTYTLETPVSDCHVSRHKYFWNACPDYYPTKWEEVKAAAPYKPGEVVYVVYGDTFRRALIGRLTCKVADDGFLREAYEVHPETKAGRWSKRWYLAHPGYIQRGYQRAGLAPEMPA